MKKLLMVIAILGLVLSSGQMVNADNNGNYHELDDIPPATVTIPL